MKISKNISFGKTLVATCQIPKSDKSVSSCKIFELDNTEDKNYFEKLNVSPNWTENRFLWVMKRLMQSKSIGKDHDTFSIENKSGDCLGYINIISHKSPFNKKSIQYIETSKDDTETKLTKQSLVAFIIEQAKREDKEKVSVLAFDKNTRKFFTKECGFKHSIDNGYDFVLDKKHYDKFLEKHKQKTGSEITFIS